MQSRKRSLKEAAVNIAVGFSINYCANLVILPLLWNGNNPFLGGLYIGIAFTIISCVRQYAIRRWFTKGD
jgi:hypothetical protein